MEKEDYKKKIEHLENQIAQLKHAGKINSTLFDISNAVNTTPNLADLYLSIHQSLNRLIHVPNIYISIYDREKGLLHFPYYVDEVDFNSFREIKIFKENSLTGEVILSKKPLFLDKKQLGKRAKDGRIVGTPPQIWLGVPLINDESVFGVIAIQNYTDPDAYTKKDLEILISVSHQIAVAIDRKRINEALKENEERYRTLCEKSHDIIMRFDKSCCHLYVNPAIEQLGFTPEQMIGKTHKELDFPEVLVNQWEVSILNVFETGQVNRIEFKLPDGLWIDWLLCPEFGSANQVKSVITFARDITERKQVEFHSACYDKINKNIINAADMEQMFNGILDTMIEIFNCDRAWILFPCNPNAASYSMPFLKARPQWHKEPGYNVKINRQASDLLKEILRSDDPVVFDKISGKKIRKEVQKKDFVLSQIIIPIFPKTGEPWAVGLHQCSHARVWTREDSRLFKGISQRIADGLSSMLLFRELRQTKNYFDNVINSMPSILMGVDLEGRITQWNYRAKLDTGIALKDVIGQYFYHLFPHLIKFVDTIKTAIDEQKVIEEIKIPRLIKGKTIYENITIYPLKGAHTQGAVIRMDDVTQQIQMEEMMIQSEKMLSIGGLAAGMAHEINNPLAGMMQNAQLVLNRLSKKIPGNEKIAQEVGTSMEVIKAYMDKRKILNQLEHINEAGARAAGIVQNMLSFAKKAKGSKTYENLARLLDRTIELAQNDYDLKKRFDFKQIKIRKQEDKAFPLIFCEPGKIQQVFLNIIKNGTETMVEFKEKMTEPPEFFIRFSIADDMGVIQIKDNGPGMTEDVRKRVFEPFYTTKSPNKGTGLGLSVAFFIIVEEHQGELSVESAPGQGANFIIKLPIHD